MEVGDGGVGVRLRFSFGRERHGAKDVDRHMRRQLVQTLTCPRGKEGIAVLVDTQGASGRVRRVEECLRRSIGIGRSEHPRAQPVARNDVGLVQGQIRHKLDRPPSTVGWKIFVQPVDPGCHGQEADVDDPR